MNPKISPLIFGLIEDEPNKEISDGIGMY